MLAHEASATFASDHESRYSTQQTILASRYGDFSHTAYHKYHEFMHPHQRFLQQGWLIGLRTKHLILINTNVFN